MKRNRTSPEPQATSTTTNATIVTPTLRKLPERSGNSSKKLKTADHDTPAITTMELDGRENNCSCSSIRAELATFYRKVEERIEGSVMAQVEKLQRDCSSLARLIVRISNTLSKIDPHHSLHDKLELVSDTTPPKQTKLTPPSTYYTQPKPCLPTSSTRMDIENSGKSVAREFSRFT